MKYQSILLGIGVISGLFLLKKTRPAFLKLIFAGLAVCFILSFFNQQYLIDLSFFVFGTLAMIYTAYTILNKSWLSFVIGGFAFLSVCFDFFFYSYAGTFKLFMIIPIVIYLLLLWKWKDHENELSVLTVLAAYELSELLQLDDLW